MSGLLDEPTERDLSRVPEQVTLARVGEIVGRDAELESIERWLARPWPSTLLIEGEAGIGKTTLWRAALELAHRRDLRILRSEAAQAEATISFTVVRDLLDASFDEVADELPAPQRNALEVTLLRREARTSPPGQGAIAVAFLTAVKALGARRPTVLAIDDVQWVDPASAPLLQYALRRLGAAEIAILLARRVDAGESAFAAAEQLDVLPVGPLSLGALGRILHERLGSSFARPTLHRLHETSAGNPLFALELARALESSPEPIHPGAPLPVPSTLQELVSGRLGALPPETIEALTVAASLSRPTVAVVGLALGRDATPDLERAARERVVTLQGDEIRFQHPLLAACAYDDPSSARRRDVHQRLAAIAQDVEEQARHLALSTSGPDAAVADALEHAAGAARARNVSAELYDAAARATPEDLREERTRRATAAAAALFDAGDAEGARARLENVIVTAQPSATRMDAVVLLGRVLVETGRRNEAMTVLRDAIETTSDPAYTAEIRSILATLALFAGSTTSALEHAETAIAAAQAARDDGRLAYALAARAMAAVSAGEPYEAYLERALELEREAPARSSAWDWSPTHAAASCALRAFDVDEISVRFGALYREGSERGNQDVEQYGAYGLAVVQLALGRVERAAELTAAVAEIADVTGVLHLPALRLRAEIEGHCGRASDARRMLRAVLSGSEERGEGRSVWQARAARGALELADGRAAAAARELRAARNLADDMGIREPAILLPYVDEAEAASQADLPGQAQEALAAIRALPPVPGWGEQLALRAEAAALVAKGDLAEAEALVERAVTEDLRRFSPLQYGRTLLALGRARRRSRQIRAARATLAEALEIFDELGAVLWSGHARAELGRIGGRAASSGALTPSERRVAELVAEGRTNKEVAAELVVSVHTVEGTLTSIYRKLDVRSRTEMARKLTESGTGKT